MPSAMMPFGFFLILLSLIYWVKVAFAGTYHRRALWRTAMSLWLLKQHVSLLTFIISYIRALQIFKLALPRYCVNYRASHRLLLDIIIARYRCVARIAHRSKGSASNENGNVGSDLPDGINKALQHHAQLHRIGHNQLLWRPIEGIQLQKTLMWLPQPTTDTTISGSSKLKVIPFNFESILTHFRKASAYKRGKFMWLTLQRFRKCCMVCSQAASTNLPCVSWRLRALTV